MEDFEMEPSLFKVIKSETGIKIEKEGGRLVLVERTPEFLCGNCRIYLFTRLETLRKGYVTRDWFLEDAWYHRLITEIRFQLSSPSTNREAIHYVLL